MCWFKVHIIVCSSNWNAPASLETRRISTLLQQTLGFSGSSWWKACSISSCGSLPRAKNQSQDCTFDPADLHSNITSMHRGNTKTAMKTQQQARARPAQAARIPQRISPPQPSRVARATLLPPPCFGSALQRLCPCVTYVTWKCKQVWIPEPNFQISNATRRIVPTSHATLHTTLFKLPTLHSELHTVNFTLPTSYFTLLEAAYFALHTLSSHFTRQTSHSTLHTSHFTRHTPHFTLHTSHCTLHTLHSTLHTPHFTLHTPLHTLNSTPRTPHHT